LTLLSVEQGKQAEADPVELKKYGFCSSFNMRWTGSPTAVAGFFDV
jgi:hypothetical protein